MSRRAVPRLPLALLGFLLPNAERDEVLADLTAEFETKRAVLGDAAARRWLWRQALASSPSLLRWTLWRDRTGFEPRANSFRPGVPMIATLFTDARYAARRLRTRPAYTVLAVLTLALGIGGTAAVFGIARPVLLEPLPYAHADSVASFWFKFSWNEEEFTHLRGNFPGFRNVAAWRPGDVTMRSGDAPARLIAGIRTSHELFDVLGVRPFMGRGFQPGDDAQGTDPVAVLSYGLWQELGGEPSMVGSRVTIDGAPRTVIGVMPRDFWYPDPGTRIWLSWPINPVGRNGSWALVGHVLPGQDVRSMDPHLARLGQMLDERFQYTEQWDKTANPSVDPLRDELLGDMRPALIATLIAMGLILLIACANVSALMLGQVEGRASEMAVRSALGATRRRIIQQLVVEALLLGVAAGLAGAGLAAAGFDVLAHALPIGTWADAAAFDWSIFAVALAIAIIAVLLVVLVPTVSFWRGDVREGLHRARTGGIQGRGGRLERGLVVTQVAIAMLIASGAALLVRSVTNLYAIDPGLEADGVAVIDAVASAELSAAERAQSIDALIAELGQLPGVRSSGAAMKLPLRGPGHSFNITVQGRSDLPPSTTYFRFVTRDYFETMGIRVLAGRDFDIPDQPGAAELPVVINQALADKFFAGENPIGRVLGGGVAAPQRVIGVVENVAEGNLVGEAQPARYFLGGTVDWWSPAVALVIRTTRPGDATAVLDRARRTVQRVAPRYAVQSTTTMSRVFDQAVGPARQVLSLLGVLSVLALVLGAIGIYGVISHFASRRKRDWAIRVALGLPGSRVVTNVVGQGVVLVVAGVLLGAVGTAALTRVLESMLYEVGTIDAIAFAGASLALLAIGTVAAFVPAWRAGGVDPAMVLREQ